jgi:hypothetical protein
VICVVYKYNYKPEVVMMQFGGRSHSTLMPTHSSKSAKFQQQELCQNYSSQWHWKLSEFYAIFHSG